jgi:hypothetical protein
VLDAFEDVDLSDSALFDVDLDSAALASVVRRQKPVERVGLSERAAELYEVALDRACVVLIHLIRELPEFDAAAAVENLTRLRTVLGGMTELLERVPVRSLDAPVGVDQDERFRRRYLHCTKQVDTPRPGSDTACRVAAKAASRWACLIAGTAVLARPLSAACAVASLGARSYELARGPTFVGIDGPSTLDSDTVETTVPTRRH